MPLPPTTNKRVDLPPLYQDEAFVVRWTHSHSPYTGMPITITLDHKNGARTTVTDASPWLTINGLVLDLNVPPKTLPVGNYEYTLFVGDDTNRNAQIHGFFDVVNPRGGSL